MKKRDKHNKVVLHMPDRYIEGIITISHKGFGSVRVKGQDDPIEIDHSFLNTACHGDTVKILLHPKRSGENQTGEVS
ncbi:MAG: hypothetical protein NTV03_02940, partial [Candidatus Nomurabacteria bacterium]|nr:hypothetical protein [Candidatus Nomurabacteria bacterium]